MSWSHCVHTGNNARLGKQKLNIQLSAGIKKCSKVLLTFVCSCVCVSVCVRKRVCVSESMCVCVMNFCKRMDKIIQLL